MRALDRKLLRDVRRLWAQALAVALVMASGVATLLIGAGAHQTLSETRRAYYDRAQFADVFASATRAPKSALQSIRLIEGAAAAEGRIARSAIARIPGTAMPVTLRVLSVPDQGEPRLNRLVLRTGELPTPGSADHAVVSESFALAHGLAPGAAIEVILNGARRRIAVAGTALSPEFVYAIGPGDMMPDDRRFGILWMRESALAGAFDLKGAFDSVSLRLLDGVSEREVIAETDRILERYGGEGAHGRSEQMSHAFLDAELKQLEAMSRILPPVFLVVTAFLINMILSRLIGLEREQIGLLKAIGYTPAAVAIHYVKLVLLISIAGIAVGAAAGTWLGNGLTLIYQKFFHFPYLVFTRSPSLYAIAAAVSAAAALAGALRAVWTAAALPPAVAMQPPAPPSFRRMRIGPAGSLLHLSQLTHMTVRSVLRWPFRALVTGLGISVSVALLVSSLFASGAVDFMLDATFNRADRQTAGISFGAPRPGRALYDARNLPGVIAAEPFRAVPVKLSNGRLEKRVTLIGRPPASDLSRLLDLDLNPVAIPDSGVLLTSALAESLEVRQGDVLKIKIYGGKRKSADAPVTGIVESYVGLLAVMDLDALNRLLGEAGTIDGVNLSLNTDRMPEFLATVAGQPALTALALQRVSLANFRKTIAENIHIQIGVYAGLASLIAFGVVYNSARIQFSERARELACLRVLGFTKWEVSRILLLEFALLTVIAVPMGWLIGHGLAYAIAAGFRSDLYRLPFIVERATYAWSAIVVIGAVAASALIVRRRVSKLDLVEVLKARD